MKIPNVKAMIAKVMTAGLVAGALMLAAPGQAQAQGFSVGVQFGGPHYGYAAPGYYPRRDWEREEFARREAFARQQAFERQQAFARHDEWQRGRRFDRPNGGYGFYGR